MKIKVLSNLYDFSRKSRLDPYFWTPSKKLKQYVKDALMKVVGDFLSSVELPLSKKDIEDIQLTGSIANYNYSKYSDIDLHILIDFSKLNKNKKFIRDYFLAKKNNWNNKHKITIYGHEVEIYVQDSTEPHFSSGVYSIKNNKWIAEPEADKGRARQSHVLCAKRKADDIAYEIDDLVSRADDEDVLEEIEYLKEKIRNMRQAGLERDGEDAVENIAFKILRRRQDLKLLSDLQVSEYDQSVSIQEDQEWWKKRRKEDNLNYRELIGFVKGVKVSKKGGGYKLNPPMKLPMSGAPGAFQEGLLREEIGVGKLKRLLDGAVRGDTLEFKNGEKYITLVRDKKTGKDKIQIEPQTYEPKLGDGRTVAFKPGIKYTAKALGNGQFEIETNWTPQQGSTDEILYNFQRAAGGICKTIVCGESELTLSGTPYRLDKIMSGELKTPDPEPPVPTKPKVTADPAQGAAFNLDSIYDAVDALKIGKKVKIRANLTYGLGGLFGSGICKRGLIISLKKLKSGFGVHHSKVSEDDKIGCFPSLLDEKFLDATMVKTLITDLFDDKEIVGLSIGGVVFKREPIVAARPAKEKAFSISIKGKKNLKSKLTKELKKLASAAGSVLGAKKSVVVKIVSGLRKGKHGDFKSQHGTGMAADIKIAVDGKNLSNQQIYALALAAMAADVISGGGLGYYIGDYSPVAATPSSAMHYDIGASRAWFWFRCGTDPTFKDFKKAWDAKCKDKTGPCSIKLAKCNGHALNKNVSISASKKAFKIGGGGPKTSIINSNWLALPEDVVALAKGYYTQMKPVA